MKTKILAVDDDLNFLNSLKKNLEDINYAVIIISNSQTALNEVRNKSLACILLDVKMPGIHGIDLLKVCIDENPNTPVLMISGQSNIKIAVEAIKIGAFDFIEKPIDIEKLHITIKNAVNKNLLTREKENYFDELKSKYKIISQSSQMNKIIQQINSLADTQIKVLIQGETGTGKELVAWALHHNSSRKGYPYIKINCAAIPSELLESELFGHHKGSFTGAINTKLGKFISADEGTLFLDEIGDMSLNLQSKILRVIEENEVNVIGENTPRKINVRIVSATNKNLQQKISDGTFREDLYYRLNVENIFIPPLRERKDDIIPLAKHFISQFSMVYNKQIFEIEKNVEDILHEYDWKGNVRELRNIIEKTVIYGNGSSIGIVEIKRAMGHLKELNYLQSETNSLKEAKDNFEKIFILNHLEKNDWKISKTAEELGIERTNLFKKMQKLGIEKLK